MRTALILLGLVLVSCGKPASNVASTPDSAPAAIKLLPDAAPPPPRRVMAPISVEEVADVLPAPTGAVVLEAAHKPSIGERVEASYCLGGRGLPASAEAFEEQLGKAEWLNVVSRPRGATGAVAVTAQKGELALIATLDRGSHPRCRGRTEIVIELHKLTVVSKAPAPGAPVPGTPSPKAPVAQPAAPVAPPAAPAGSVPGQADGSHPTAP